MGVWSLPPSSSSSTSSLLPPPPSPQSVCRCPFLVRSSRATTSRPRGVSVCYCGELIRLLQQFRLRPSLPLLRQVVAGLASLLLCGWSFSVVASLASCLLASEEACHSWSSCCVKCHPSTLPSLSSQLPPFSSLSLYTSLFHPTPPTPPHHPPTPFIACTLFWNNCTASVINHTTGWRTLSSATC